MKKIAVILASSITLLAMLAAVVLYLKNDSFAISGSDFRASRIIDDSVFYNSSSMTEAQIQAFLNSKVPSCDTSGSGGAVEWGYPNISRAQFAERKRNGSHGLKQDSGFHAPPYTCLKDYRGNTPQVGAASGYCSALPAATNQSTAQIILNVAKACGINPQVFVVLLEKEQSLITDIWPLDRQYKSATGFACPDTADCDPAYRGIFQQIYNAGKQFKIYRAQPNNYNYRADRVNKVYYQTNLGEFINPTGNASDPSRNGRSACGYSNIGIENQATAALYIYTPYQPNQAALNNLRGTGDACSAYGNRNFWRLFSDWFGSTIVTTIPACDSRVANTVCVWNVTKSDGTQFLTSSRSELEQVVYTLGWKYHGVAFYASNKSAAGLLPVYRLRTGSEYLFSADYGERSFLTKNGWTEEGIAFYSAGPSDNNNTSHPVFSLYRASDGKRLLTISESQNAELVKNGYTSSRGNFKSLSGEIPYSYQSNGLTNVYQLTSSRNNFYTTSLAEAENSSKTGYTYDGVFIQTSNNASGLPMYRLESGGIHLYTTDINERNIAVSQYGYRYEGIGYYIDSGKDIFRLRSGSKYLYVDTVGKLMSTVNRNGWTYEASLGNNRSSTTPVFRLLNLSNGRHLYTTSVTEASKIAGKGWEYENIAFSVSGASELPVYRLRLSDKYLYTVSEAEKKTAASNYGYVVEGVAFRASSASASRPVYRLHGGSSNEYFYTVSEKERDEAQSRYGYTLEGVGFYIP